MKLLCPASESLTLSPSLSQLHNLDQQKKCITPNQYAYFPKVTARSLELL